MAVSSASASDGKSLTAINLAISMARPGDRRVVLIDFDLVNPSIQRYLGITGYEKCLGDYIVGDAKPSEILYATPVENLWVVPNNLPITNSSEALGSKRTLELIEWIQSADPSCIILMDLPPLLVSDDVLAASGFTDALLLVIAEGRTSRESVRNTKELIEDHEIELLGVVINESRDKIATYKY
ncbi:MAG: CpsD/CapB family tyrosine-protein kinase [Pseudomonadota bacterium]